MKYYDLDEEEQRILEDVEAGRYRSVKNLAAEKRRFQKIAKTTLAKAKNINIRLSQKVLTKLKAKAAEEGIPYQTLVSSVLYKFVQS